jgi:hypothetical protein
MAEQNSQTPSAVKRLILCFDGTWNTPEDQTSVSRIYSAIADQHAGCHDQLKFYDPGVGTGVGSRITGGAFGWGLDENVLEGYSWLINEYRALTQTVREPDGQTFVTGPDIYIFGFSRGAFTARSLAGLINRCGILKLEQFKGQIDPDTKKPIQRAHPKLERVKQAWKLYQQDVKSDGEARSAQPCVKFRSDYSHDVKIKFLGVWDTVGALGVPMFSKTVFARAKYGFHDTRLCRVVEHAYHAVAIDEQREDYRVALWDQPHPDGTKDVEQRWFPGAHSNVGGGYDDDLLPDPPLKWMAEMALRLGLEFTNEFRMQLNQPACAAKLPESFKLRGDEYLSPVRDSYKDFLFGTYRVLRAVSLRGRYFRPMLVEGVNETIDESAHMKWAADPAYRPRNFAAAGRRDITPVVTTEASPTAGEAKQ